MKQFLRNFGILVLGLSLLAGCHELGQLEGLGGYGDAGGDLTGAVQAVDTRSREIDVRTEAGRNWRVRFDSRTRVIYRQQEYAVGDLEPGDFVALRTRQDRDGRLYTDLISVRESVQERGGRGGRSGRFDSFEGTVQHVDTRRGTFEVRDRRDRSVEVSLPYNAPRALTDRFRRLREGDFVRIEGRFLNQDRFELESFS